MDARSLSRIFALGLTMAASPLVGCDRLTDSDGSDAGENGGGGDAGTSDPQNVAEAYCSYLLGCQGPPDPEYPVDDCIAYINGLLATYAQEDPECHAAAEDYFACLGGLECGQLDMVPDPCQSEGDARADACLVPSPGGVG